MIKNKKILSGIVFVMLLIISASTVFAGDVTTAYNVRKTTTDKSGSSYAYAEYDYGTSAPNDDAYCLAKTVNGTKSKTVKCYAIGRKTGKTQTVSGTSSGSGAFYKVAQLSGEDYFRPTSYASAQTGSLFAKVTVK